MYIIACTLEALTLYRRHLAACIVRKNKISARAKRLAMDCKCPIWMYGRIGNNLVPRQSTGFNDLAKAEALRDSLIARSKGEAANGVRIDESVQKYLASHKHELGDKTYGQYELHLGRLREYCKLRETFKVDGLPIWQTRQNRPSSPNFVVFCERLFVAAG